MAEINFPGIGGVDVSLFVTIPGGNVHSERIDFTGVKMSDVHKAMEILNGVLPAQELDRDTLNDWRRTAPYPVEESKGDFTVTELFPPEPDGFTSDWCQECGVKVPGRLQRKHTGWHNKLLP